MGYYDPSSFINKSLPKFNQLNAPQTSGIFSNILDNMYKSQQMQRENDLHPLVKILKEQEIKGKQADIAQTNIDNQSKQLDLNIKQDQYNDRQQAIDWVNILKQDPSNYSSDDQIAMIDHNHSLSAGAKSLAKSLVSQQIENDNILLKRQSDNRFFISHPNIVEDEFQRKQQNEQRQESIFENIKKQLGINSNQQSNFFNQQPFNSNSVNSNTNTPYIGTNSNGITNNTTTTNQLDNQKSNADIIKEYDLNKPEGRKKSYNDYINLINKRAIDPDNKIRPELKKVYRDQFIESQRLLTTDFLRNILTTDTDDSMLKDIQEASVDGRISRQFSTRLALASQILQGSNFQGNKQLNQVIINMAKGMSYKDAMDKVPNGSLGGNSVKKMLMDLEDLFINYENNLKDMQGTAKKGSSNPIDKYAIFDMNAITGKEKDKRIGVGVVLNPEVLVKSLEQTRDSVEDREKKYELQKLDKTDYSWIPYNRY